MSEQHIDVNVSGLAAAIMAMLEEYADYTQGEVEEAVKQTAKEAAAELRKTSPKDTGAYAKAWKVTKQKSTTTGGTLYAVHNPTLNLSAWLEHGHPLRRGGRTLGRVQAYPHIKPVEDAAASRLEQRIKEALGR